MTGFMFLITALPDLIFHKGVSGEVYIIGSNNERSNLDVVKTIIHSLGKSEDLIDFVADRLDHDKRYAIDLTKLQKLGWKSSYNFETGIAQTINWYLDQQWWWSRF